MVVNSLVVLLLVLSAAPALSLNLRYDSLNGRLYVETKARSTPSIYWDKVAQDIVGSEGPGPTIAAHGYAVMHSAIFHAWFSVPKRRFEGKCSPRRIAAAMAASKALRLVFPKQARMAHQALRRAIRGCPRFRIWRVRHVAKRAAVRSFSLRVKNVLRESGPMYPWKTDIVRWTAERVPIDSSSGDIQKFLTAEWGQRFTYGIRNGRAITVKEPEPFLLIPGTLQIEKRTIIADDGRIFAPVSSKLVGEVINPKFITQTLDVLKASANITPEEKFSAELWEQGGGTSYPPGCWMTIASYVSVRDRHKAEDDVRMYYALSNALSDAGVATWHVKRYYNYARPVRVIRDLGKLGLLGKVSFYDVTKNRKVIQPAEEFITFQDPESDPSPPFAEYTSGHSGFSSAAAEVLKRWTGSDRFGAVVVLKAKASRFERGVHPKKDVKLSFQSFTQAAKNAGSSRIYGGIHFKDGNIEGLKLGRAVGAAVFLKAKKEWLKRD